VVDEQAFSSSSHTLVPNTCKKRGSFVCFRLFVLLSSQGSQLAVHAIPSSATTADMAASVLLQLSLCAVIMFMLTQAAAAGSLTLVSPTLGGMEFYAEPLDALNSTCIPSILSAQFACATLSLSYDMGIKECAFGHIDNPTFLWDRMTPTLFAKGSVPFFTRVECKGTLTTLFS
jgi:hypothetical protein